MKISVNWLSDYIDTAPLRADLVGTLAKLTMRGLEVEAIHDLSKGFEKVIVAQIESRERHPNADRLSVCLVNTGDHTLQIVCGAQNMKAGDKVALSMIGALLPNGMKIEKGKIRDVESFGMLCSETELGISETSEGILILPTDAPIGKPVAEVLGREDVVFEVNVTPNRGDALSHLGIARELAAILDQKLKHPKVTMKESGTAASSVLKVKIDAGVEDRCYQYHGRYIDGVKIGPSPEWLVKRLTAVGLRPINNVVDITNFLLMDLGTPLHAFDASQVRGGEIHVRLAQEGEQIPLLDKTEVKLTGDDLVIADKDRAIALAGVMGGGNSEVSASTTALVLEAAQFSPSTVRRTAKRHQKHSDSSYRFERQIDAEAVELASERAAALIAELAGGHVYKGEVHALAKGFSKAHAKKISVSVEKLNAFLGLDLAVKDVTHAFKEVGFAVTGEGHKLSVSAPSYRPDVEGFEDLCEEVLRVWGYDRVTPRVPRLEFIPEPTNATETRQRKIEKLKLALVESGFSEAVNFAFTSKSRNDLWGGAEASLAVSLENPLNEEFSTLKTALLGGLFENFLTAVHHQGSHIRLFEIRPVYLRDEKAEHGVREEWRLAGLFSGRAYTHALAARDRSLDFYDAKGVLENVLDSLNCRGLRYDAWAGKDLRLHPAQTATISLGRGPCGYLGRLHPKIEAENKVREPVYVFEVALDRILELSKTDRKFSAIAKFPKVPRDFSFLVPEGLGSDKVLLTIQKHGKPLLESVQIVDVYSGEKIPAGTRSLSVALILGDANRTLADAEVEGTNAKILKGLETELGVKLRLQ